MPSQWRGRESNPRLKGMNLSRKTTPPPRNKLCLRFLPKVPQNSGGPSALLPPYFQTRPLFQIPLFAQRQKRTSVGLIGFEPIKAQPSILQTEEDLQLLSKPMILVLAKGVEPLMLTRTRRDLQSRAIATLPNQQYKKKSRSLYRDCRKVI